jgi:hypothetical protein
MSERQGLGKAGFSINPARTAVLEAIMESALLTRTAMIAGQESASQVFSDAVEPTMKSLQDRLDIIASARARPSRCQAGGLL